ncbi:exopolyphosphatase/guanosine-5'-triphosphate,3'-diphosphate pyrophosphatase [Thermodesulfitimonas autotrophica]|uniref:Exopolyphosphatase/guanosine-5'-triphosphate, 3'-diphosphate pyrophosphatase n=1 Tax=Thermodesulfitimonas autotrophica TaxID=1894989 RepID=A0A3N5AA55_9THEO|nr:Ppx/GppA family phosphatase [Thermodesulfitimonas autotrophica]RPF42499.1 exopolyphosphatase/guanosine-5'-triphosphate,3'-diphosphate pyrophosphatase [Thermodesulfitimonas autotrophica]
MRVGVIDIGTNSTRYLLAEVGPQVVDRVETALKTTRLGEGLVATGRLSEQAMARTAAAVAEFWRRAQTMGAKRIIAVATCAVREAANREDFLTLIRRATGLEVRILSGTEEAFYTFCGAMTGLAFDPDETVVIDIGGGSTEIIWMEKGRLMARSLPLGAVRLTEQGGGAETVAHVLAPVASKITGRRIIGTGGTITTLAAVALALPAYDPARVHGYELQAEEVVAMGARLAALSLEERRNVPGLQPERADVILAGIRILTVLLELTGAPGLTVSEHDLLYGVAAEAVDAVERKLNHRP